MDVFYCIHCSRNSIHFTVSKKNKLQRLAADDTLEFKKFRGLNYYITSIRCDLACFYLIYASNSSYYVLNEDFFRLIILIHSFSQKLPPRLIYVRTFSAYRAEFICVSFMLTHSLP